MAITKEQYEAASKQGELAVKRGPLAQSARDDSKRKRIVVGFRVAPLSCSYILFIYTAIGAAMKAAKLFKNGDSQAVRLPKEFRFKGTEVLMQRVGDAVVLLPKSKSWATLIQSLDKFPPDFMLEREQPLKQDRRKAFAS